MGHPRHFRSLALFGGIILLGLACVIVSKADPTAAPSSATPLMGQLERFSAADVPTSGPAEIEVKPRKPSTRPVPTGLPGNGLAQHPMLYIGEGYNKMFLVNGGKIIWTYSTGPGNEYDDVWMLSNGNILFTRMQYIAEVTPKKEVVWRYDAPDDKSDPTKHTEIHACQPIGLDKVLFIENGLPPRLKVINIKTNAVEVDHALDYLQPPDPKKIHPQFRRVRLTAAGTYLVPYLNMGKVVEYDKDFKEVWSWPDAANIQPADPSATPTTKPAGVVLTTGEKFSPWAAIRLKNGNTLITNESGKSQIEVSPDKRIVWELKPEDLPEEYRYKNTQSCTRLANGNTIVCSRMGPQLVEVTPDKKVVWVFNDFTDLGPATAVQVLDDPGIPEIPGESEH
jgi:hypothetical protein